MPTTIAAIDVGSNAIRLAIGRIGPAGQFEILHSVREPVRLGQDVFSGGFITPGTMKAAAQAFSRFREQLNKYSVTRYKAVATSAVREAKNGAKFTAFIAGRYGIEIALIGPEEEARLVHLAIKERVRMDGKIGLLVDIGGGSVEISLATGSGIISSESYAMGSVRLLQILGQRRSSQARFNQLVNRYVDATRERLKKELGGREVQLCVATGGSVESIGDIRQALFGKKSGTKISSAELQSIVRRLQKMTVEERMDQFQLRPDRADVIFPAAVVLQKIVKQAGVDEVLIPGVGVKDGVLAEIIWEVKYHGKHVDRDQVISSAIQLGRKYSFDEQHGQAVSRLALQIFDQTRPLHDLDGESRLILEVASLLHDIGHFIGVSNHHKHTFYLLHAGPIVGLTPQQMLLVANVARYHRKSLPRLDHEPFRILSPKERSIVSTLVAILRVADSLDRQHDNCVQAVEMKLKKPSVLLRLRGKGDMLLEKWSLAKRCQAFEELFGELILEEDRAPRKRSGK